MRVLDLFSGIGGFSLGLEAAGMRTIAFCEIEPYCRAVLRRHWPDVPIHEDVRALDGGQYRGAIELVCGGYPCQPFSMAGRRRGEEDKRHLWPEMYRLVREIRPRWVVAENVAGHISLGFDEVASSLEAEGFTVWPFVIPACAVGAPHRRDRVWIVGHAKHDGSSSAAVAGSTATPSPNIAKGSHEASQFAGTGQFGDDGLMADTKCQRLSGQGQYEPTCRAAPCGQGETTQLKHGRVEEQWSVEPNMGRVAYGVPNRVERLRALGNTVVPQIPFLIGQAILQYEWEIKL